MWVPMNLLAPSPHHGCHGLIHASSMRTHLGGHSGLCRSRGQRGAVEVTTGAVVKAERGGGIMT